MEQTIIARMIIMKVNGMVGKDLVGVECIMLMEIFMKANGWMI
jgi:hypothetical protein